MASDDRDVALIARIGRYFMYAGVLAAILGVSAWIFDVIPAMPAWMVRIAIYKLTLAGAAGMLFVGAALRRTARRAAITRELHERAALAAGALDLTRGAERAPDRVPRASDTFPP